MHINTSTSNSDQTKDHLRFVIKVYENTYFFRLIIVIASSNNINSNFSKIYWIRKFKLCKILDIFNSRFKDLHAIIMLNLYNIVMLTNNLILTLTVNKYMSCACLKLLKVKYLSYPIGALAANMVQK